MIELPNNLKPKTKIAIFKLQNIVYAVLFAYFTFKLIDIVVSYKLLSNILKCLSLIIAVFILIFEYDSRNFIVITRDYVRYKLSITDLYSMLVSKKVVTNEKPFCENNEINKLLNIADDDLMRGNDGYYYNYLEVKISKNPKYETRLEKQASIQAFNKLLIEVADNGKLFCLNIEGCVQSTDIQYSNLDYDKLKKYQFEEAKQYRQLRYFIEIRAENQNLLNNKISVIRSIFNENLSLSNVDIDTLQLIYKRNANIHNYKIYDNYIEGSKFETYLSLASFNNKQDMYYLQKLFSSSYDIVLIYRKPSDLSDMKTLNGAYAELMSNQKYDRTITGKIKNESQRRQLYKITNDLESAKGELFAIDIIVKITAGNLNQLNKKREQFLLYFNGTIKFKRNTFVQKETMLRFYKLGVSLQDNYIIPDQYLAYSYPFNYVKFVQNNGLLKNIDNQNLLFLDYQRKSANQLSFGFIIFGDKGSGKSTYIKEKALDDIYHYKGNVIMLDFDSETETMVNNFSGSFIDIAGVAINIMRVHINPISINNVEDHIVFVVNCIKILYKDLPERLMRKVLAEVYQSYQITNDSIFDQEKYPTITDVLGFLKNENNEDNRKLIEILEDFDMLYPYLTRYDYGFEFSNQLISISFNSIKRDNRLTNMMMYYFVTLISKRTSLNHFSPKYYPDDDYKLRKYLMYYMSLTNDIDNYKDICNLSREQLKKYFANNKKMFSIIIDEAHRIFQYPMLVKSLIPIAREDRKYYTSLTFADQSTHSLETNSDFLLIYSLMQYKIFFQLEETNISFLKTLNFLPQEINEITNGSFRAGEGILKIGSSTYKINSKISAEIDNLFEGRH